MQVPVPGATVGGGSGTIDLQFTTSQNAALATQLLEQIYAAEQNSNQVNVETDYSSTSATGSDPYSEYVVGDLDGQNTGPGQATVPNGYDVIVNAFTDQPATISGPTANQVETVLSGEGGLTFYLNGGSGTVMAGGGNNLIEAGTDSPVSGSGWYINFDGGNNTVYATIGNVFIDDGSSAAAGSNQLYLGSGHDTVQSYGSDMIVAAPGGVAQIVTYHAGTVIYGNTGQTTLFNQDGNDTFVAGGGDDTVYAAAGGGLYFGNAGPLTFVSGADVDSTVVAGQGAAVLYGAPGSNGTYFVGRGVFMLDGGSGSQTVVGSAAVSGNTQGAVIFSENGGSITLFGNTNNNLLVAGSGNVTLNAAGTTGNDVLFAGSGSDCMVAGSGNNVLVGGAGSDTLVGGPATTLFEVNAGADAGGNEILGNWSGNDQLYLFGYGSAGANGLPGGASLALVNGSEVLTLADGTRITFSGVDQVNAAQIHSG